MPSRNIAVFASGGGSNLQALLDAERQGKFKQARIHMVFSDQPYAGALERGRQAGCQVLHLAPSSFFRMEDFNASISEAMQKNRIDLICLAGYMRILAPALVNQYRNRIINIHPSLLPAFGGRGMFGSRVHEAVLASGARYSGCTVHFVDEGTDTGPIILQQVVPVDSSDTPSSLAARVLREEHILYPRAVELWSQDRLRIEGRRVIIS